MPYFSQEKVQCRVCGNMVCKREAFVPGWIEELVYECVKCPTSQEVSPLPSVDPSEQIECFYCKNNVMRAHADILEGETICSICLDK